MDSLLIAKQKLDRAKAKKRSKRWCLYLWGRFIKLRDGNRCLVCLSNSGLQAHHIFRKSTFEIGALELGNGITLCNECHVKVHAAFNGKADLSKPLGAEGGDDQDEAAYLYGLLCDDARERGISEDEYYFISDDLLSLFVRFQGYEHFLEALQLGQASRVRIAHEIWRSMPEKFYEKLAESLFKNFF